MFSLYDTPPATYLECFVDVADLICQIHGRDGELFVKGFHIPGIINIHTTKDIELEIYSTWNSFG